MIHQIKAKFRSLMTPEGIMEGMWSAGTPMAVVMGGVSTSPEGLVYAALKGAAGWLYVLYVTFVR